MDKSEARTKLRNRVVGHKLVRAGDILPNPLNWRTHSDVQKAVVNEVLDEIGIAKSLLVRETDKGKYELIDGHLRQGEYPPDQKVPVEVVDVNEEEAYELLCVLDPSAALAGTDKKLLQKVLRKFKTEKVGLIGLFGDLIGPGDTSGLDLDMEGGAGDTTSGGGGSPATPDISSLPTSTIKMVQLFLSVDTFPKFEKYVEFLMGEYGTDNPTETVMKALAKEYKTQKAKAKEAVA